MPVITIAGTPITIPDSGASPNWAPGIIEAFQAIETAFNSVLGTYDIAPQIQVIDSNNPGTNVDITNLSFPTSAVVGAFIKYSVVRTTSTTNVYESGNIIISYNPNGPISNKWELSQDFVGDADISFSITDAGQFQFSTTTLGGLNHTGKILFAAQAQSQ